MGKVTIIAGGIKTESRLTGLTQLAANELVTNGLEVNIIEVHKINAEALVTADFAHSDIQLANSEIESSSGVIIATPIFKAAYSGVLKAYLDLLPLKALKGKVVLPLGLGGSVDKQIERLGDGLYEIESSAKERLDIALGQFISLLNQQSVEV
ncbi:FMN reductase (NADPH) [Listeria monocytogenes]|nr:FMN reductase (NADPH) [Listeria monocytogenes]